jgi:aspartyl-tRNA(Asn)/glutamyl-tRNA(Gln) amidotransferase subunit C
MMAITTEEILHLCELARIDLTGDEIEKFQLDLSQILDYVTILQDVDTSESDDEPEPDVEPQHLRDDIVEPSLPVEEVLRNASNAHRSSFSVPKVIKG